MSKEEIQELREEIGELEDEKEKIEDSEDEYEKYLNECYPTTTICGMEQEQGTALRELDNIAFREGFNNWTSEKLDEIDEKIAELKSEIKELEENKEVEK